LDRGFDFLKTDQFFFQNFDQGVSYKFFTFPASILMLESIFLDFWKDKFTVHILCFISLLILCLDVEVIKRLLWPPNEPAAPFKNGQK